MAKRQMTDEQKERARQNLAKARAARAAKAKNKNPQTNEEPAQAPTATPAAPPTVQVTESDGRSASDIEALLARVQELEASAWRSMGQGQQPGAQVNPMSGRLTGTFEKFVLDPDYYPSPIERLGAEERLSRFAFPENYELKYEVTASEYTTIDGIRTREPKFTLDLIRKMYDEETGELTPGRYTVCRLVMHEDPDAAIAVARQYGMEIDEEDEKAFLDEMRYLRMRDWLLEAFYHVPVTSNRNRKEMVINNQVVEYFEVNSEESSSVPFDKLKKARLR